MLRFKYFFNMFEYSAISTAFSIGSSGEINEFSELIMPTSYGVIHNCFNQKSQGFWLILTLICVYWSQEKIIHGAAFDRIEWNAYIRIPSVHWNQISISSNRVQIKYIFSIYVSVFSRRLHSCIKHYSIS